MPAGAITPVTVLTGFLGSGKTTLLNRVVADARFRDTAVVVNEWGEVGIDHALVREAAGDVVLLPGGCICCRAAGDVQRVLRELHFARAAGRVPHFSRVVIETTGLADPGPLVASLAALPLVAARYALAGVVATVDAEHGMRALDQHAEAVKQAAMADLLVVTKEARATPAALAALEERLRELNPGAGPLRGAGLDVARVLDTGPHRGPGGAPEARGWLASGAWRTVGAAASRHDPRIASFAWTRAEPSRWADVESALAALLRRHGGHVLRLKGLVGVAGEPGPRAVHAVHHTLYPSARLPAWPDAGRATRLVLIVRDLEPAAAAAMLDSIPAPANP